MRKNLRYAPPLSVGEEIGESIGSIGSRIEGAEEFSLDVFSQAAALAAALDHFMGYLLGGGCHQIVRLQPQFR